MTQPDLADLLDVAASSRARSLHLLAATAARVVPGCAAASAVWWLDGEPALTTSSHPDLAWLVQVEILAGRGPMLDALDGDGVVSCPELLDEGRWPEYADAALAAGARCTLTLAREAEAGQVCLTMAGARPGALDPDRAERAEALAALGAAVLGAVERYDDARRTVSQLKDAAAARSVVDQAKGVLMRALGCGPDEALRRIRQVSQDQNLRATEVARDIVTASSARRAAGGAESRPGRR
ncbi:MAG: GAF and ANTAR domain-containing protein [Streptosporangiaceae bacterium]